MYFNALEEGQNRNNDVQRDRISDIRRRAESLLIESKDPAFSDYLRHILMSVKTEEERVEQISADLERNYRLYCMNMQRNAQKMSPQTPVAQPTPVMQPEALVQPEVLAQPTTVAQPEILAQPTTAVRPENLAQSAPAAPPEVLVQPETLVQPTPAMRSEIVAQPTPDARTVTMEQPMSTAASFKTQNAEFTIGAAVLSVVGGAFILTAMVLFGLYFMQGMMKGILLYAVCIIGMLLAEFGLYRRWPKLGMTISAIGMIGLYISTIVNYLVLHNFNEWVALALTAGITLFVIMLSRKRDAAAYRVLGIAAMYGCLLLVFQRVENMGGFAPAELFTVAMIGLLANVMCVAVPVKKAQTALDIIHMSLNASFAGVVYFGWLLADLEGQVNFADAWHYLFFALASICVTQLIFVMHICRKEVQMPGGSIEKNIGISITYVVVNLVVYAYVITSLAGCKLETGLGGGGGLIYRLICSVSFAVLYLIPVFAIKNRQEKWLSWYFLYLSVFLVHWNSEEKLEFTICVLILLVLSKILSFGKNLMVRNSDAVITGLACAIVLLCHEEAYVIPLFIGVVFSVLCINYWKTYFETMLAFTIALYTSLQMLTLLKLPVFVGILFVAILIFNNVKRWHGEGIVIFNISAVGASALCYLMLVNPVYQNAYLTYLCMLIFGVAMIVICFQRQYHLEFEGKHMVMAVFLTYMGLVVRTNYAIINSILLMLTALACVGTGFYIRKKELRIYGLVLALLVCGKLVIYDFGGANTVQKTIVFLVVGIIALVIAAIYMILEKNLEKNMVKKDFETGVQVHESEEARL